MNFLQNNFLFAVLFLSSSSVMADAYQKFYDDTQPLMTEHRKCMSIENQFSQSAFNCYKKVGELFSAKTENIIQSNNNFLISREKNGIPLDLKQNEIKELKDSCRDIYPTPLRQHFKNQILACKTQTDINNYFRTSFEIIEWKGSL